MSNGAYLFNSTTKRPTIPVTPELLTSIVGGVAPTTGTITATLEEVVATVSPVAGTVAAGLVGFSIVITSGSAEIDGVELSAGYEVSHPPVSGSTYAALSYTVNTDSRIVIQRFIGS